MRTLYSVAIEAVVWLLLVPLELVRIALGRSSRQVLAERLGSIRISEMTELRRAPLIRLRHLLPRWRGGEGSRLNALRDAGSRDPSPPREDEGEKVPKADEGASARSPQSSGQRRLLIHAVSAGEMSAASALVHEMEGRGWSFVISAGNDDARLTAMRIREHHAAVERIVAWPWDRRRGVDRWLEDIQPDAVAVIETEIWPNLFLSCRDREIPLIVAGARIDAAAARSYRRLRRIFAPILATTAAILAVDEEERQRYLAIGVAPDRVSVAGSLKAEACFIVHGDCSKAAPRAGRRIVCASTHAGEEELITKSVRQVAEGHGAIDLVLVPRHPRRAASVRREVGALWPEGHVDVVDRMGALSEMYAGCDLVIIGGTFAAVGGHDVFEPARAGCAIVAGPHVEHIRGTVEAMRSAGAIRTTTAGDLASTIAALLSDDAGRRRLGECARTFAAGRTGASVICADRIEGLSRRA